MSNGQAIVAFLHEYFSLVIAQQFRPGLLAFSDRTLDTDFSSRSVSARCSPGSSILKFTRGCVSRWAWGTSFFYVHLAALPLDHTIHAAAAVPVHEPTSDGWTSRKIAY